MGTACSLGYENIFMARFDQKHIYPFIKAKVDLNLRYIDDIFFIWKSTEEELKNLFNGISKKHPSIKFDQKYLKSKIEILDVLVYKDEQQRLQTTLFKKKTNNLIFMQNLATQRHSKKVLPTVEYCVSKKNYLTNSEFERNCKVLQEQFTKKSYDSSSIETEIKKIKLLDRKDLLTPKTTQKAQVLPLRVT